MSRIASFARGRLALRRTTATRAIGAVLAGLALVAAPTTRASAAPLPAPSLGVAWYPEQWPEARWDADLALMEKAHVRWVRITEFAWSTMEPREGVYDFGWLDRAIAAAARHHIDVVLGTPTAAPPAWLTRAYPETLRTGEDQRKDEHGGRQQFNYTDPHYLALARDIAERMAERYGQDPHVVGWQIDNELAAPSFDAGTKAKFHAWLKAKYGDVATLNARWTTAYWSQTYDSFGEVPMRTSGENPGLILDYRRFVTDAWVAYTQNQVEVIRAHKAPGQFITTNTMGWHDGFDHYALHAGLDLAAWDEYVPSGRVDWMGQAVQQDLVRGFKRKNFWIMETQPAVVNWWSVNRALDPGQTREMAWQAVGHGADAVGYWQWRSALNGQEQYHGALVGADGTPAPVYAEIAGIGGEFDKAAAALAGTTPHARVAMLNDYPSRWAIDYQRHTNQWDTIAEFNSWYRPLEGQAQAVDVISADADLDGYALVVAPALNVLTEAQAARLTAYVQKGGHLVLGPRSGMKDADNALQPQRQPGPLAGALGGRVEQYYVIDTPMAVLGPLGAGQAVVWAEALSAADPATQVLLRYAKGPTWLSDQPAVLTRRLGKGEITYVGAWFEDGLMRTLSAHLLQDAGVRPILPDAPDGVEVCERRGASGRVLILINHTGLSQAVALPGPMRDLLGGGQTKGTVTLPAHGVGVYADARRG